MHSESPIIQPIPGGHAIATCAPVNINSSQIDFERGTKTMHERKIQVEYNLDLESLTRKKRVCAYARVSSDKEEAFHSLSAQISYYQNKIAEHPGWEFVEVFYDRGVTGTKDKREGFQRMLTACREGKIDIILAKSITRFARNTVILLQTVRELKSLGVDIHFEEEHIETLSMQGELMTSIIAARAQEESRQASENQKWHYRKSYEKGVPVTGNCYGYRLVNHQFLIEEEEEPVVLRIFSLYLSGMGKVRIAKTLTEEGYKTKSGKTTWNPNTVMGIITNEKYCGDLILQKYYRPDFITKKNVRNKGDRPQFYVKNAHDGIVQRDDFETATELHKTRAERYQPHDSTGKRYPFSGMIVCGKCGQPFYRKASTNEKKYSKPVWMCNTFNRFGKEYCDAQQISETILTDVTCKTLGLSCIDEVDLHDYLEKIVVPDKNLVCFVFKDGSEHKVEWNNKSRRESWTPEMKERARKKAQEIWKKRKEKENGAETIKNTVK